MRLYQDNIIQPRDNHLQVIEVNLDTKGYKMTMDGTRLTKIWEKNDFIMTYRVTQIIYKEIQRLESLNIEKNTFAEAIIGPIEEFVAQDKKKSVKPWETRTSSVLSDMGSTSNFTTIF